MCDNCNKLKQPYTNIVESIALEQTAISHILNAEGEKIQKILATTSDLNNIMLINKSVNETVKTVTNLELILSNKLKMATSGNFNCCDEMGFCKCNIDGGIF